ncbi:MAG TPA: MazG-like family protein [Tissierellaceae bacterium]|nr:MazG-like family protein [Tissierellaceae bacterium]
MDNRDIDIVKNMKTVEWLKSELLTNIAYLHRIFVDSEENSKENIEDTISNIIMESYVLAKRLGIAYKDLDRTIEENIRLNLIEEHKIERWYGDLSNLLEHIETRNDSR